MTIAVKEFKYSMITFILSLLSNITIISLLYYFFNIRQFPPKYGRDFWIIAVLILLAITFFIKKICVQKLDLSSSRKSIIIFTSMFCSYLIMLFNVELLSHCGIKTKEIPNIESVYSAKSRYLVIKNFEVIRQPIIYSHIVSQKKPVSRYAQVIYIYPFKSEKYDIFYCLKFKKDIEGKNNEERQKKAMNDLLLYTRDTLMKKYDFQKIKTFEYITKMSPEYNEFSQAISSNKNVIFLKPNTDNMEKKADKEILFSAKSILVAFLAYIAIFLLTRVTNWK
ncbi:hypothetical protein SAMN05443633_101379 [Chryseobacterium arachidis]|uniref:Uncharacterized protein n=1 Tax=Chryseobacterium arachidis TaxID=1416778 RepID=A0A1M4U149_9FLAO|nr:hypothetical protein [Chryseobacterium arachidis]SHE50439.1 hypothetical protein SAMN05443633_101379 [Chryseobacterium arachidis]